MQETAIDIAEANDTKSAAIYVSGCIPQTYVKGFCAYTKLSSGKEVEMGDALEVAHLKGLLEGMAEGRLQCGDSRVIGGLSIIIKSIKNAYETNESLSEDDKAAIHEMAGKLYKAVNYTAKFGLGTDRIAHVEIPSATIGFAQKVASR